MTDPFAGAEPTIPPYASWGQRFAAILVDGFILAIPFFAAIVIAVLLAAGSDPAQDEDISDAWAIAIFAGWAMSIVAPIVYYTVLHGRPRGQTVGKRLLGIRVVGEDFNPIGYGRAFGRVLISTVFWFLCYVPGIVDVLWPLWDEKKQALHDKVVNTVVVRA